MATYKITAKGLVQGIGYRPFVAETAEKCGVGGWVRNTDGRVTIFVSGETKFVEQFLDKLKSEAPAGAFVEEFTCELMPEQEFSGFSIVESDCPGEKAGIPRVPADLPTCGKCLEELHDTENRRYRHPFISCTSCGPRYSIIERLPYDRDTITMKKFAMCDACDEEYRQQGNRRRHAQTIACPDCGPKLKLVEIGAANPAEPLSEAIRILEAGGIVAVKDIGGYHLACTPFREDTVAQLRRMKGREKKPFAVMFPDVASVKEYCFVNEQEEELLLSMPRPIVLLRKKSAAVKDNVCEKIDKAETVFAENVCGTSPDIGAILPCNPVQTMLVEALGALIMTSANASGELLILDNEKMETWMYEQYDAMPKDESRRKFPVRLAVLSHDRPILTPLDDSIVRVVCGRTQIFRRARGYVPEPIKIPVTGNIFAAGGDLKSCFCHTGDGNAYLSQYLGDIAEEGCFLAYQKETARMKKLFGFAPEKFVCDLHPGYVSGRECEKKSDKVYRVQHHEAHVASVIAEHALRGTVLGFAFDGTGYGRDKTVWGSEVFLWKNGVMKRAAHLKPVRLIGGDEGAKNADTIFYGYLASFGAETKEDIHKLKKYFPWMEETRGNLVEAAVSHQIHTVESSSMGRLFDAVSAFLDVCHYNQYEGEAAIELENLAAETERAYPLSILCRKEEECWLGDTEELFGEMLKALENGAKKEEIARGFIYAVADFVCQTADKIAEEEQEKVRQIAISGGTFQNRILLERVIRKLEEQGHMVYINEKVPCGDGGICLGQAYLCEHEKRVCEMTETRK